MTWRAAALAGLLAGALLGAGRGGTPGRTVQLPAPELAAVFPAWEGCAGLVPAVELTESDDRADQGRCPTTFRGRGRALRAG